MGGSFRDGIKQEQKYQHGMFKLSCNPFLFYATQHHYQTFPRSTSSEMSCSLIEAKFQVLDRTIKLLSKSKSLGTPRVASSEQFRALVETQKPTSLLPTIKLIKGEVVTRSNQSHSNLHKMSRSQPNTSREEKYEKKLGNLPPRPSTGRRKLHESSSKPLPDKWIDPKQQRAEQLLQDTRHEIESAVNWGRQGSSSIREVPRSKLLDERTQNDRHEFEAIANENQFQERYVNNQVNEDAELSTAAVHNALPAPKRPLTSAGLQTKKSRAYLSTRCRSASSDHQPKNWFAPTPINNNLDAQHAPKAKRKNCRQRPVSSNGKQIKENQSDPAPPCSNEQPQSRLNEIEHAHKPEKKYPSLVPKSDDPSFYMLELRLVNPEPLTGWSFQASFTDTSVSPTKTVILDDLTADDENCLLFDNAQSAQGPTSSRYFNPFLYFPGLHRPSDLYGHVLRILVTSIKPVTRIVINTAVQFTHFPDEPAVVPPVQSIRQHSEAAATQETNLLRATVRRSNSASSASRRRISKPRKKKTVKPPPPNNYEISTTSLAMDQCSPWISSDQDELENNAHSSVVEQVYTLQLEEPRSPSSAVSPRVGPTAEHLTRSPQQPLPTVDKKKMELQRLRANMRKEMSEHKIDDCNL